MLNPQGSDGFRGGGRAASPAVRNFCRGRKRIDPPQMYGI